MSSSIQSTEKQEKKQTSTWQDRIQENKKQEKKQTSTWQDRMQKDEEVDEPGMIESAIRGGFDGASFGFLDEIAGGLEAAGSTFGVRGLGEGLFDIRWETEEEDEQSLGEIYEEARDKKRDLSRISREANPVSHTIGEIGGGMAVGGALLNGTNTIKQAAKVGALDGAVTGAGYSEADSVGGVFEDAVVGGTAGAALGGAFTGAGKALKSPAAKSAGKALKKPADKVGQSTKSGVQWATKKFNKTVLDLDDDISEKLMEDPEYLKGVKDLGDIENEIIETASSLKKGLQDWDNIAWDTLDDTPLSLNRQTATKRAFKEDIRDKLKKYGHLKTEVKEPSHLRSAPISKEFISPNPTSQRAVKRANEFVELFDKSNLSIRELKSIIKKMDSEINWDKQELEPINHLLKEIRTDLDWILKEHVPQYRIVMEDLSDATATSENARKQLKLKKDGEDLVGTQTTSNKLNAARRSFQGNTPNKDIQEILEDLSRHSNEGVDHLEDLKKRGMMDRASGGVTNGSKGVVTGGIIGGGIGISGIASGGFSTIIGLGGGLLKDKFGRDGARKLAEAVGRAQRKGNGGKLSRLVGQFENNYGRFFEAASAGTRKPAINHFLLYNKDSEYRELMDQIDEILNEGETDEAYQGE